MNVQMVKYNTFKRHARNLLEPAINHKWKNDQQILFQHLRQRSDIAVGGDMKADAPGEESSCLVIVNNVKVYLMFTATLLKRYCTYSYFSHTFKDTVQNSAATP